MPQNVVFNGTTYAIPLAGELNWSSLSNFLIDVGTNAAVDTDQKQSIRVALASPIAVAATTDYAVFSNLTVPGAVAYTLPAGINGQIFVLGDGKGDADTNNITITPSAGQTINGAATLVLNKARQVAIIQYHAGSTDWKIQVVTIPPGTITDSDIAAAAAIARTKIAAGTASQVVVNDPSGVLSSVAVVPTTQGGTGQNSTAVFPTSGNVTTDSNTQTFTNKSYDASGTGNALSNVADSNIASAAAIARTKIASGTASQVVINDPSGVLSSEAQLAGTRGGTGVSSTATYPTSGVIVTESGTETLTNKSLTAAVITDYEVMTEVASPTAPAAGSLKLYAKTDNNLYIKNSANVETALGGTGVTTVGPFGGTDPNGLTISGSTINLAEAGQFTPGGVSTAAQSFTGDKIFLDGLAPSNSSDFIIQYKDWTNYTPNVFFTGNANSVVTINRACYTRINDLVALWLDITIVTRIVTTGSDVLEIQLPIPALSSNGRQIPGGTSNDVWSFCLNIAADTTNPPVRWNRASGGITVGPLLNATASDTNDGDNFSGFFIYSVLA